MFSGAADVHVVIGSTGTLEFIVGVETVSVGVTSPQTVGAEIVVDAEGQEAALVSGLVKQLVTVESVMILITEKAFRSLSWSSIASTSTSSMRNRWIRTQNPHRWVISRRVVLVFTLVAVVVPIDVPVFFMCWL